MHLQSDRAGAHDLPAFSPGVAGRTDRIKSASRGRQSGITDQVAVSLPIPDPTKGLVGPPLGKAVLLEERAERFQAGTIHVSQEPAQARPMGKLRAPKQGHECRLKGRYAMKEVGERPFAA